MSHNYKKNKESWKKKIKQLPNIRCSLETPPKPKITPKEYGETLALN